MVRNLEQDPDLDPDLDLALDADANKRDGAKLGIAAPVRIAQERWPEIPVLIITGFASISSAVEATQLGAAGYVPKPFTPEELEDAVGKAVVQGPWKRPEPAARPVGKSGAIDVDLPFDAQELEKATSAGYVEHLTRSDMPIVTGKPRAAEEYCSKGARSCKRFTKRGMCTDAECPIVVGERKKAASAARVSRPIVLDPIDVDMPFSAGEVAAATSDAYVAALGRSDMPVVGHWTRSETHAERVLVIDDEAVVVNSIRKILLRKGYSVEAAFSGMDAMSRIMTSQFDLVLLDMRMPDQNGLDLLPKIKNCRPDMPVVIVTGYASIETAVDAIRRGAADYLGKPFSPDELTQLAERVLRRAA